jgi:hypothetical protein
MAMATILCPAVTHVPDKLHPLLNHPRRLAHLAIVLALCLCAVTPRAFAGGSRSISEWVTCDGTTDQTSGAMAAFAAARNQAFTLVVDCAIHLDSALAVDRGIFIDNGTTVQFTRAGKFFVNNMFHPAFVIANSSNISLLDWNVEWDGSVPVNPNFGGYTLNGQWVAVSGSVQPAAGFNDVVLTNWLENNRGIKFDASQGWIKSIWVGGINPAAVFFITGDSSKVVISGMNIRVPAAAGGNGFMPVAFSTSANWKSNQTVTALTSETAQYAAVPQLLTFKNIILDGTLMGWQGNLKYSKFDTITSERYGDLQDADGNNVGGIGKWFPPPHLFYLNTQAADPNLANHGISLVNINDKGMRIGVARDKGGSDSHSGYAASIKLSCMTCSIMNYTSRRPDGFLDLETTSSLTVNVAFASFDSTFLNNLYPPGIRFPSTGYTYVNFQNVAFIDNAAATLQGPFGNATSPTNHSVDMSNFQVYLTNWVGSNLPVPKIVGTTNDIDLNFSMSGQLMTVTYQQSGILQTTVQSTPTTVNRGAATALAWNAVGASGCSASGAWSGNLHTSGSRLISLATAGTYEFTLGCANATTATTATTKVYVQ